VIRAIGAESENAWYVPESADEKVLRLSHAVLWLKDIPVVSGGDLTNSVKSVADAIASGKQAAMAIDVYYKDGWDVIVDRLDKCRIGDGDSLSMEMYIQGNRQNRSNEVVAYEDINTDYFNPTSRMIPQVNSGEGPLSPFSMMEPTFSQSQAMKEAGRCFQCGNCNGCDNCRLFCPEMAVDGQKERNINLDYCKGCGICVEECPRNAMSLVEEKL
jgi:Pyruvate/2-oxoacid:ferredoxin oxidoreductase delta subunit